MATIFVYVLLIYVLIGLLFALAFVLKGLQKIDEGAVGTSWRFRLLMLPGTVAFWPWMLIKWIKS